MDKFILPKERIPKPFNQNKTNPFSHIDSCVACTFTKILEVIYGIELSKGYMYGRNNYPDKKSGGMNEEYTLNAMLKRGSVPLSMCSDYDEIPDIVKKLKNRADIAELDREAEKYRIKAWENISGKNRKKLFENVKTYFEKYNMPIAATIKNYGGGKHSVVAVGYDGDKILWQNHDGTDTIHQLSYTKFCSAYYLEGVVGICLNEDKIMLESANDITWELNHSFFPIADMKKFVEELEKAKKENSSLYWGYYKLANKIK